DIAWTPCGKHIYVWAPIAEMAFSFGFIDELVDPNFYQGWSYSMTNPVTWFSDPDPADDDFGTCTLANLKAMSNGGIVAVLTHGQIGQVEIARCATEAAAMAWKSSEADMVAVPGPLPATNYWSVIAFPAWFSRCWKPSLDQRKTIVFLEVCYSSDGYPSIASSVGGQTVFSSYGSAEGATTDAAFLDVIDKMHTTVATPNKSRRVAASAFSASSVLTQNAISLLGDGLSTLCPAPQTVFPASPVEARSGWGCILFDSYMDSSVSADTAVILTAGTVGTRSWGGNGQGHFYVSFPHAGPASVEAIGGVCRSKGGTIGRPLDGDAAVPMPENGQSKEWGW
ncbi:MAG: hypothetical protein WC328_15880, partial [Kiritimatiellia bacterium]